MRIAREITTLLASLFNPTPATVQQAAKESARRTTPSAGGLRTGGSESLSPGPTGNGNDRVTFSDRAAREGAAIQSVSDARLDLPSTLIPAFDRHGSDAGFQTPFATGADHPVVALLPAASVDHHSPRSAADFSAVQETPETRRLVRSVYGSPQTASRPAENESGPRIRIRA